MPLNVYVEKCQVPIIWIDTSIIILLAKWKYKPETLSEIERKRARNLYNNILINVCNGRLICPFAEQEEEVFGGNRKECFDVFNTLTFGIQTNSVLGVLHSQMSVAMQAHVEGKSEINLSFRDAFLSDPVEKLKATLASKFYVTVNRDLVFGERHVKDVRDFKLEKLNEIRERNIRNGKTFEQHLDDEYNSRFTVLKYQSAKVLSGDYANELDEQNSIAGSMQLGSELTMLENTSGKPCDLEELSTFYRSDYYRELPYPSISAHVAAKLMTDPQPIRTGDFMDIEHAATMVPYVDMFITDKAMRTYLKRNGFDSQYGTKVSFIGDSEDINSFFASL